MSLFGSNATVYLRYDIYLTDKARVAQLQAVDPANPSVQKIANMAPQQASIFYGAPIQTEAVPFVAPCTRSPYITAAKINYPYDLAQFDHSDGGWFGLGIFANTTHFVWRGYFTYSPPKTIGPVATSPLVPRRWLDGFELMDSGGNCSRDASRHQSGYGWKFDNTVTTSRTHAPTENYIPFLQGQRKQQWERFYVRIRVMPSGNKSRIWRVHGLSSANAGAAIDMLPDGTAVITFIDAGNVETLLGVAGQGVKFLVNVWHKIDIVFNYFQTDPFNFSPGSFGTISVFLDGKALMFAQDNAGGVSSNLSNQEIGNSVLGGGPANGFCWDADDWFGAEIPSSDLYLSFPYKYDPSNHPLAGLDWNNGSQIMLIGADGFGSDNSGTWVGDWRLTRQHPIGDNPQQLLTVTGTLVRLTVKTDAGRELDTAINSLGMAAIQVSAYQKRAAGADGKLGFRLGALTSLTTIVQFTALQWNRVVYSFNTLGPIESVATGGPLAGIELIHDSGLNGSLQTLMAEVELIGVFGDEDIVTQPTDAVQPKTVPPPIGIHNAPYSHSPWARRTIPPISPVVIVAGTYVGNATFQDLPFKCPVHFFWIRPLTGGAGGFQWFSSMNAAHQGGGESHWPDGVIEALIDPLFNGGLSLDAEQQRTIIRLAGNNANSNAAGVTYQYLAICDPGQRFFTAGALKVFAQGGDIVNALDDGTFTPEACFAMQERNGASLAVRMFFKGIGHAAGAITQFQGTAVGTGLKFSNGTLTSQAGLMYSSASQIAYLAMRRNDGSQDPGIPRVLGLASYIGDGSASRTVSVAPPSGRFPLFALVVPHTDIAVYRDPSHTGTTSTTFPTNINAATGITSGGIDSISVGSALNVNGVVYDVLVIPGDLVSGNNGFSINGEFAPVAPIAGAGTQWDTSPASPEENATTDLGTGGTGTTGGPGSGGTVGPGDLTGACAVSSLQVINTALSHLGVSKRIAVVTELTQEADTARLHYQDDVDATLRDFPWPFATRYADLVLVAGTATVPVNGDWQYAYRTPDNMMFARRIVNPSGARRKWDPTPVPFRLGSDNTGWLIYSNAINSDQLTLTLEYTIRIACAATAGDAIFRSALSWRHAHSLAPTLSRDEKKGAYCWQMYKSVVGTAATMASSEQQQEQPGGPDWLETRDDLPDWLRWRQ